VTSLKWDFYLAINVLLKEGLETVLCHWFITRKIDLYFDAVQR